MNSNGNIIIIEGRRATGKSTLIKQACEKDEILIPKKFQRTVWEWYDMDRRLAEMRRDQSKVYIVDRFHLTEYAMRLHDYATNNWRREMLGKVYDPRVMLARVTRMRQKLYELGALTIMLECYEPERLRRVLAGTKGDEGKLSVLDVTWSFASAFADIVIDTTETDEASNRFLQIVQKYKIERKIP